MAIGLIGRGRSLAIAACVLWCGCSLALAFGSARAVADGPVPYKPPESVYTEPEVDPDPAECPEVPEALDAASEEYSDELVELRWIRIAAVRTCRALAGRSDLIDQRLWWSVVESAEGRSQRSLTNDRLATLIERSCESPCAVQLTSDLSETQTGELVSAIDSSGEAMKVALWVVVGTIVGSFVGSALWKTVHRGL